MARKFKPRTIIPKQKLIELLEEGYTLDEIGERFNKSRSYISEMLTFHDIKTKDIEGRKYAMKQRRKMLESRSFIDVLYDKIKRENKWNLVLKEYIN